MRRAGPAVTFLAVCALAGGLAAIATAQGGSPGGTTGSTDTLPAPTTTTATTSTETTPTTPSLLPPGITIGGISVGGLAAADAKAVLQDAFAQPIVLRYRRVTIEIAPERLGARASFDRVLARAGSAAPNAALALPVNVPRNRVVAFLGKLAERFARDAVDSKLLLRHARPVITRAHAGVRIDVQAAATAVVQELRTNTRTPLPLPAKAVPPNVTPKSFPSVIVIRRGKNLLSLYRATRLLRVFGVATGQSVYPTPLGRFSIMVKWRNPWWYPPASPWAKGQKPIPPGPGNPLGTRWMGLSAPGVGIHGTPDDASIGYSVSHGCIRMHIPQAEWLFDHVEVGTPVFIIAS